MDFLVFPTKNLEQAVRVARANRILNIQERFTKELCHLTNMKKNKSFHIKSRRLVIEIPVVLNLDSKRQLLGKMEEIPTKICSKAV
jgi:hypothetical protein